jgi:diaminobutyrate-2-oxoglutarate transaminase
MKQDIFDQVESNVRYYCRYFPEVFCTAKGSILYSESGKEFIDFFSGAGALNYGHNHPRIKESVISYLQQDGILQGLDMRTVVKRCFLQTFQQRVLSCRGLNYKVQFCGPTGTNGVEAALRLARKVKQRAGIFAFTGSYHGMTQGSLSVSGNAALRQAANIPQTNVTFMPYPHAFMTSFDTIGYIDALLSDPLSGVEKPAAMIVETIQAEGGVICAPYSWLRELFELCARYDILLIVDDIQAGCFRTGTFFSFEGAKIKPDIVILSKSLSGIGFPMTLLLIQKEWDKWFPGEFSGTFRGNELAFLAAEAALSEFANEKFEEEIRNREDILSTFLHDHICTLDPSIVVRGRGLLWGIDLSLSTLRNSISQLRAECFGRGLIIEACGRHDQVLKLLPPLTIPIEYLLKGCSILRDSLEFFLKS